MTNSTIMAIKVNNRKVEAHRIQDVLTEHGCVIKVRLGVHDAGAECSDEGLILLQLCGGKGELAAMESALNGIDGVKAVSMEI